MVEPPNKRPHRRERSEAREERILGQSALVEVEIEPTWRPLVQFTVVTAICMTLFLVILFLVAQSLVSLDFSCGLVHGTDRARVCGYEETGYGDLG
ncbi:hypothetical protein [Mycetocola zhujimingii]|uniref:Uncharacterized protein n=1 Tax=Mycetocola zhujimingii TaxID=2079792 RepID=A0A2U1TGW0_9MICO|nr:hypothetical protein [Mycetocola zhujimingii]PWC08118.1 hypothetical protein DF223_01825 [Mycetocola zhujimingii]